MARKLVIVWSSLCHRSALPPELALFPWDIAKAEFGFVRADLVAYLAVLVIRLSQ